MKVFVDASGLVDNLGDSVLRREWINALRPVGQVHAFVGRDALYTAGLNMQPHDTVYQTRLSWICALSRATPGGCVVLALSAGELSVHRQFLKKAIWLTLLCLVVRLGGGKVLLAGVGFRGNSTSLARIIRPITSMAAVVSWRDEWTRSLVGSGEVNPDWAFRSGPSSVALHGDLAARKFVAISMRGDRPEPDASWVASIKSLANDSGCSIVVVTQVRSDHDRSERLATLLNAVHLAWCPVDSHCQHEAKVRSVYSASLVVVSDRIHALVIGLTEGAVPVGYTVGSSEKVSRTFGALTPIEVGSANFDQHALQGLLDRREDLLAALSSGRNQLSDLESKIMLRTAQSRSGRADTNGRRTKMPVTRVRVLQSLTPPDGNTRYVDQITAGLSDDIVTTYFSWKNALLGRYDLFHVHWPEYLLVARTRPALAIKGILMVLFLIRLRVGRTPVIRTAHNIAPHDGVDRGWKSFLLQRLASLTTCYIRLNGTTQLPEGARAETIPLGHYRDRFAPYSHEATETGRILFFGLIRGYKGIEALMDLFVGSDRNATLRIVGKPLDPMLACKIAQACADDNRITSRLEFVDDEVLVKEISMSEVVILPYTQMHNSSALLVALSVGRTVVAPRTPANELIAEEVGSTWLQMYEGPLSWQAIDTALSIARSRPTDSRPNLSSRDWQTIQDRHRNLYLSLT